jgi:hypothetical protein
MIENRSRYIVEAQKLFCLVDLDDRCGQPVNKRKPRSLVEVVEVSRTLQVEPVRLSTEEAESPGP